MKGVHDNMKKILGPEYYDRIDALYKMPRNPMFVVRKNCIEMVCGSTPHQECAKKSKKKSM